MAEKKLKLQLIPSIKKLEISTKAFATGLILGRYKSSFRGKGLEFDTYRSYLPDDDASMIDWKASARSDDILVKQFVEERNVRVFLLIDVSSTMLYGSSEAKLKIVYATELAASLCYAVLKAKDSVGFGLFTDHVLTFSMPSLESQQFYKLCKTLLQPENYGGNCDLGNSLNELFTVLPDKTILIIISDFIGVAGDWQEKLTIAGKKFEVIGLMIRDIYDRTLPAAEINLLVEDPYTDRQVLVNPATTRKDYEKIALQQEAEVIASFRRSKGEMLTLATDKPFLNPLVTFFKIRARKWR